MKTKLLAASLLLLGTLATRVRADDWKEFKSEAGGFSVLLPGTPKEQVQKATDDDGDSEAHIFITSKDGESFFANYTLLPAKMVAKGSDKVLNDRRDAAVTAGTKVRSEKKIALAGNPGREVVLDTADGATLRIRNYIVKDRLYEIVAYVDKGKENGKHVEAMFDSFKLTGK